MGQCIKVNFRVRVKAKPYANILYLNKTCQGIWIHSNPVIPGVCEDLSRGTARDFNRFLARVRFWPMRLRGQRCFEIALSSRALNRENGLSQAHGKARAVPPLVVNSQKDQVTVLRDSL